VVKCVRDSKSLTPLSPITQDWNFRVLKPCNRKAPPLVLMGLSTFQYAGNVATQFQQDLEAANADGKPLHFKPWEARDSFAVYKTLGDVMKDPEWDRWFKGWMDRNPKLMAQWPDY